MKAPVCRAGKQTNAPPAPVRMQAALSFTGRKAYFLETPQPMGFSAGNVLKPSTLGAVTVFTEL